MNALKKGLPYRLLWALLALALSFSRFSDFSQSGKYNAAISALGWALFAAAWFMQPVIATAKLSEIMNTHEKYAIGPAGLRVFTSLGGALCLLTGVILKMNDWA
jgi:hypothetical protein